MKIQLSIFLVKKKRERSCFSVQLFKRNASQIKNSKVGALRRETQVWIHTIKEGFPEAGFRLGHEQLAGFGFRGPEIISEELANPPWQESRSKYWWGVKSGVVLLGSSPLWEILR